MNLTEKLKSLTESEVDALVKTISQQIIKDPSLDSKSVTKSLSVLNSMIVLNEMFDFNTVNLVIDNSEKAVVQDLIEGYFDVSLSSVFHSNHPSDTLGVGLAIALESDARTIVMVDDSILNYGKTFESLIQIVNYHPDISVIFYDSEDQLIKSHTVVDSMVKNIRMSRPYTRVKKDLKSVLSNSMGKPILDSLSKMRDGMKHVILEPNIFSQFGFNYHGEIDGQNFKSLKRIFTQLSEMQGTNLIHVNTDIRTLKKLKLPSFKTESGIPSDYVHYMDMVDEILSHYHDLHVCIDLTKNGDHLSLFQEKYPNQYFVSNGTYHSMIDTVKGLLMLDKKVVVILSSYQFKHIISLIQEQIAPSDPVLFIIKDAGLNDEGNQYQQGIYDIGLAHLYTQNILMGQNIHEAKSMIQSILNNDQYPYTIMRVPDTSEKYDKNIEVNIKHWELVYEPDVIDAYIIGYGPSIAQVAHKSKVNGLNVAVINASHLFYIDESLMKRIQSERKPLYVYDLEDIHHTLYRIILTITKDIQLINISIKGTDLSMTSRDLKQRYQLNTDHILNLIKNRK